MTRFTGAFDNLMSLEGGYVNDPEDPGGETRFGISKRSYPDLDIPSLTLLQAREIYKKDFWDRLHLDELPEPLDVLVFDAAVNQGPKPAVKMLQRLVDARQDGYIGERTRAAIAQYTSLPILVEQYLTARALRYVGTRNFDRFGKGWLRRLFRLAMDGVKGGYSAWLGPFEHHPEQDQAQWKLDLEQSKDE